MIFMGEEFAADQPFPFFCDFEPGLAKLVREGRRNEFAKFAEFRDPASRERIPDPTAEETFLSAKLDWTYATQAGHADWVSLYRELLSVRRREIVPRLKGAQGGRYEILGASAVSVRWRMGDGAWLSLTANLSPKSLISQTAPTGRLLWGAAIENDSAFAPWSVRWSIEA
jgi:maltooligosyltrehalose trehalohydrolase